MVSKAMILIWMRRNRDLLRRENYQKKITATLEDMRHDIEVLSEDFNAE